MSASEIRFNPNTIHCYRQVYFVEFYLVGKKLKFPVFITQERAFKGQITQNLASNPALPVYLKVAFQLYIVQCSGHRVRHVFYLKCS